MLEREKTLRPEVERYASEYLIGFVNVFSVVLLKFVNIFFYDNVHFIFLDQVFLCLFKV